MSGWIEEPDNVSTSATRGTVSTALEYTDKRKRIKSSKSFASKNDYWKWFTKYGHDLFVSQFGEEYMDNRPDHNRFITQLWEEAKEAPGGWQAAMRRGGGAAAIVASRPRKVSPPPIPSSLTKKSGAEMRAAPSSRRLHFMRNTTNEVNIRAGKVLTYLTSKLKIVTSTGVGRGHRDEDDVLRDLRCFFLIVHQYTSNIAGNKVAPAEITLLTYSLSRGMQTALSYIIKYKPSLVTDRENLNEQEYSSMVESTEKTGIAVDRLTEGTEPTAKESYDVDRVKAHLLEFFTEASSKNAPILVLKDNYNEAAGTLFTLFPEYWERLEARICFLDDMFKVYMNVQKAESDYHPIRDYQNLTKPPPCPFHQKIRNHGEAGKLCTLSEAVRHLQILFKSLSDGRVLNMEKRYDPALHLVCHDRWDKQREGPQLDWDDEAREEARRRDDEIPRGGSSSDDDSDDSLGGMPMISEQRSQPSAHATSQRSRNDDRYAEYGNTDRRDSSQTSSGAGCSGGNGYGRSADYGREAAKENWRQESQKSGGGNGYGSSSMNGGGSARGHGSDEGGKYRSGFGNPEAGYDRPKQQHNAPPPGFEDRDERDVRPAQRRRAASPTQSDRGGKGGKGEKEWDDDRGTYNQGSSHDVRRNSGDGSASGRSAGGGSGGAGTFSRPRGGGGVFGNRPVIEGPLPLPRESNRRRDGLARPEPLPQAAPTRPQRYLGSWGGSDSCPVTNPIHGDEEQLRIAHDLRLAQRRERDLRNYEEREGGMRGGRPTARDRSPTSPRDGGKRREDRLNPVFGGIEPQRPTSGIGFFGRGVAPARGLIVPATAKREEVRETQEEAADRREDEKIAQSIKLLPRGSFDEHIDRLQPTTLPKIVPHFRPYLWTAAKESLGLPMTPEEEERCNEKINKMSK